MMAPYNLVPEMTSRLWDDGAPTRPKSLGRKPSVSSTGSGLQSARQLLVDSKIVYTKHHKRKIKHFSGF